jgi:glycosyltransferase involved in cell wall biosynthesis
VSVIQIADALSERDDVARVVVIAERGSMVEAALREHPRLETVPVDIPGTGRIGWRAAWQAARLPALIDSERADALLSFSGIVPRQPRCRVISVVLNPIAFEGPWRLGDAIRRWAIARTAGRGHRLYVPSQAMAELVDGLDAKVVPLGVDGDLFRPSDEDGDEILAVGDFYRFKRYDLVIAAWELLPEPRPPLRIVGNPAVDPGAFTEVSRLARDPRITVAGFVELDELIRAYRSARAFVIASEHESFAMPLAEALSAGVPAVARHLPSLRETGGDGALYVDGDDPQTWSDAIARVAADDETHARLRAAGLRHVRAFSWPHFAETVVADVRA